MTKLLLPGLCAALMGAAIVGCAPEERRAELDTEATGAVTDTAAATETDPAAAGAVLTVAQGGELGPYIADREGRALYLFVPDSAGQSTCYDACAEAWPPYMAPQNNPVAGSPEIQSGLIGTIQRKDGSTQVTYGGHPLYYFVKDQGPGKAAGQHIKGFGGEWYLVTPAGQKLESHESH